MLVLCIIATVLVLIDTWFILVSMIKKNEMNLELLCNIFVLITIWVLYSH
jgi:hypothetical protein